MSSQKQFEAFKKFDLLDGLDQVGREADAKEAGCVAPCSNRGQHDQQNVLQARILFDSYAGFFAAHAWHLHIQYGDDERLIFIACFMQQIDRLLNGIFCPGIIEQRKYNWVNGLLKNEEIAAINLLPPSGDCCEPVSVDLTFEISKLDPLIILARETEKLYEKSPGTDLRYELVRIVLFEHVKKAPELFEIFMDMAQPILIMVPKLTPTPPSELW